MPKGLYRVTQASHIELLGMTDPSCEGLATSPEYP